MDKNKIIEQAKKEFCKIEKLKKNQIVQDAFAWLDFLGLLRNNYNYSYKTKVKLKGLLMAAEVEPRIYELLPLIMHEFIENVEYQKKEIPKNLKLVLNAINANHNFPKYHYAQAKDYLQWFQSPALKLAKQRLKPKSGPRKTKSSMHSLGLEVRRARINSGFTQKHLATRYNISLRVLRDIEQGRYNVGLDKCQQILKIFKKKFQVIDA